MPRALLAITFTTTSSMRTEQEPACLSHPYQVLIKNGLDVDFVPETGTFGWDENSLAPNFLSGDDKAVYAVKEDRS